MIANGLRNCCDSIQLDIKVHLGVFSFQMKNSRLKLTSIYLQVIEPILKVHRAYRHAKADPHCDQYVLCEINSHNPNEKLGLGGFKSGVLKFGSYAASWFISEKTRTPFWTLFASVNNPYDCKLKYPVECQRFHDTENKVTTEYPHTEL